MVTCHPISWFISWLRDCTPVITCSPSPLLPLFFPLPFFTSSTYCSSQAVKVEPTTLSVSARIASVKRQGSGVALPVWEPSREWLPPVPWGDLKCSSLMETTAQKVGSSCDPWPFVMWCHVTSSLHHVMSCDQCSHNIYTNCHISLLCRVGGSHVSYQSTIFMECNRSADPHRGNFAQQVHHFNLTWICFKLHVVVYHYKIGSHWIYQKCIKPAKMHGKCTVYCFYGNETVTLLTHLHLHSDSL